MTKKMDVNTTVSFEKLTGLVSRIDTLEKSAIANRWVKQNTVITREEKYRLLAMINFKKAVLYNYLASKDNNKQPIPDMSNIHKIQIKGVREIKVG